MVTVSQHVGTGQIYPGGAGLAGANSPLRPGTLMKHTLYLSWAMRSALLYVWEASRNVEHKLSQSPTVVA